MKEETKRKARFFLTTYPCGLLIGFVFQFLRAFKIVRVQHWEHFPHWKRKLIVVSNHPSLIDPFLLPALFFRQYLPYPSRFAPWSTPDRKNFFDKKIWFWIRSRSIPIDRRNTREELRAFFEMKRILNKERGVIILFPEGGRTCTGKEFLCSEKGNRIRRLKGGIGWLALRTGACVLPVWVEGTDKIFPTYGNTLWSLPKFGPRITIKIGKLMRFKDCSRKKEEATLKIAQALLKLADE